MEIPGYYDKNGIFVKYDITYYCNYNKIIHNSEKEYKNCKNCNKITIKNEKS